MTAFKSKWFVGSSSNSKVGSTNKALVKSKHNNILTFLNNERWSNLYIYIYTLHTYIKVTDRRTDGCDKNRTKNSKKLSIVKKKY